MPALYRADSSKFINMQGIAWCEWGYCGLLHCCFSSLMCMRVHQLQLFWKVLVSYVLLFWSSSFTSLELVREFRHSSREATNICCLHLLSSMACFRITHMRITHIHTLYVYFYNKNFTFVMTCTRVFNLIPVLKAAALTALKKGWNCLSPSAFAFHSRHNS